MSPLGYTKTMNFADLYLVSDKLRHIEQGLVDKLEGRLGFPLPAGYADFVTTLGIGTYCGLLRVYEPQRILDELEKECNRRDESYRGSAAPLVWTGHEFESWDEQYFWEAGLEVLSKEQILSSILFADTIDGDNIIFNPDIPDRLFVLPRDDDSIYWVPESFKNPLLWRSQKGIVRRPPEFRYFESWRDRACVELFTALKTFELSDLAQRFTDRWSDSEIHTSDLQHLAEEEDADQLMFVFIKAIGGRVQLDKGADDGRVSIRIDYDADGAGQVDQFVQTLQGLGFYETFRY